MRKKNTSDSDLRSCEATFNKQLQRKHRKTFSEASTGFEPITSAVSAR